MKSVFVRTLIILVVLVSASSSFASAEMKEVGFSSAMELSLCSSLPQDVNVFESGGVVIIADYVASGETLSFSEEPVELSPQAGEEDAFTIKPQSDEIMDWFRSTEAVEKCL